MHIDDVWDKYYSSVVSGAQAIMVPLCTHLLLATYDNCKSLAVFMSYVLFDPIYELSQISSGSVAALISTLYNSYLFLALSMI